MLGRKMSLLVNDYLRALIEVVNNKPSRRKQPRCSACFIRSCSLGTLLRYHLVPLIQAAGLRLHPIYHLRMKLLQHPVIVLAAVGPCSATWRSGVDDAV